MEDGNVTMFVFGMFNCGTLNVGAGSVLEISGGSGGPIWASLRSSDNIRVVRLCCPLLESNGAFLKVNIYSLARNINAVSCIIFESRKSLKGSYCFCKVAQAQANIEYLMDYLDRTLMAISEAWETILLEMDKKLSRYAEANPPGAVAADFLELLMIGIPSVNLEFFLLTDLTEKGLKKLGHSIEMCYSNIQVR